MVGDVKTEEQWLPLREDIDLIEGDPDCHGAPSWTLHDRTSGKFYKIGWLEFEILMRWHTANPSIILQDIEAKTLLRPLMSDIQNLYQFLATHFLLRSQSAHSTKMMVQMFQSKRNVSRVEYLLKNYLFFRIPLWRPDKFLDKIKILGDILFTSAMGWIMFTLLCVALFLVFRDFSSFIGGFQVFQTPSGLMGGFIALAFSKLFHEMGHAMLSKHYQCRVPAMGVAFIVLWPLLWTDTTDAWRLRSHKQRLCIDGGGMLFELSLAIIASILWAVLPEGNLKGAMHMLAGVTWLMTLLVNLNPFMRFDGYYLLSDATNIPNLQERGFAIAKWWMRSILWGLNHPKPENFSKNKTRALILYSFGTWIYRFFLFLGIALIVYHFTFKALGILLFIVEVWWFILKPIKTEISFWIKNRVDMALSLGRKIFFIATVISIGLFVAVPWKGYIVAPAIYKASQEIPLLAPHAAKITNVNVINGQEVTAGDILFSLENSEITQQLALAEITLSTLQQDQKNRSLSAATYRDASLRQEQVKKALSDIEVAKAEQALLIVKAPISGYIVDIPDELLQSQWIKKKETLGILTSSKVQVESFVKETDLDYLSQGAVAQFYDKKGSPSFEAQVTRIETTPMKEIIYSEMSADKGGDLAVSYHPETNEPIPNDRIYRVILTPHEMVHIENTLIGSVRIQTKPQSLLSKVYKKVVSIIIQESGL